MADAVTSQKLIDSLHRTAYKFTNISDGSGESDVKKVDFAIEQAGIKSFTDNLPDKLLTKITAGLAGTWMILALLINLLNHPDVDSEISIESSKL